MGFLTLFPPYLSPCSLAAFFRKQKQQRKKILSISLNLQENSDEIEPREDEPQQQEIEIIQNKPIRRRLLTVGPNWIMHSYNRHIRNQTFTSRALKPARLPSNPLSNFSLVSVHNCRLSNRIIPSRRPETCDCCPIARSGHRIFADEDFIYILGGYNQIFSNDKTYTDAWRFNRLTQQWELCTLAFPEHPLPNTLASFSLVPISTENPFANGPNEVYIFGGTGFPFGQEATNKLHRIRVTNGRIYVNLEQWESDESMDLEQDENGNNYERAARLPPRMYGHAMCYRLETDSNGTVNEAIYLIGGTSGHIYNMDIWRVYRPVHLPNAAWKSTYLNMYGFETGRYRLEAVIHEQMVYTFGGGAPDFCAEFDEILAFNLIARKFELHKTLPDPIFGLPRGRKCHALVQKDNMIYIIGGCRGNSVSRGPPEHEVINDVWRFNLNTLSWNRIRTSLPLPVYFHSATLTPDGCIFVFGGCMDENGHSQTRVNHLQQMWLTPPSLKYFASTTLLKNMPENQRKRISNSGVRLSDTEALISRLFEATIAA